MASHHHPSDKLLIWELLSGLTGPKDVIPYKECTDPEAWMRFVRGASLRLDSGQSMARMTDRARSPDASFRPWHAAQYQSYTQRISREYGRCHNNDTLSKGRHDRLFGTAEVRDGNQEHILMPPEYPRRSSHHTGPGDGCHSTNPLFRRRRFRCDQISEFKADVPSAGVQPWVKTLCLF